MPTYCYKCPDCGSTAEVVAPMPPPPVPICVGCGKDMKRDYATEKAVSTFHPTVDLYANSLKRRAVKNRNMDR